MSWVVNYYLTARSKKYLQLAKANDLSMLVPMMKTSQQLHPYLDSICQLLTHLRGFGFEAKAEDFRRSGLYYLEN